MSTRLLLLLCMTGCAHLQSVSVTAVPPETGVEVSTEVRSPLVFLGVATDHDYVDDVVRQLRQQCAGGRIQGILTKHEVVTWPFVSQHRITASGRCIR